MTHRKRRYLFWLFVILFVVITVKISLYASGRRLNFSNPQIVEKTGLLVVETTPSGAIVTLNNGDDDIVNLNLWKSDKTMYSPVKIKNLKPDSYRLKIELAGYWPILKDIRIYPGQSLFLDNLSLVKKSEALMLYPGKIQNIKLLDDGKHLLLEGDKKTFNWNTDTIEDSAINFSETVAEKTVKKAGLDNIKLSVGQGENIFYANDFEIYRLDSKLKSSLVSRSSQEIRGLAYDSDKRLIYSTEKLIKMIDLSDPANTIDLIQADEIGNIILKSDQSLYFSAKINNVEGLYKLSIK